MATETKAPGNVIAGSRRVVGWKCPYTHALMLNEELTGYGNPPRSPACPVGAGAGCSMLPIGIIISVDGTRAEFDGPPSSMWS